jgi:hypothetical protein
MTGGGALESSVTLEEVFTVVRAKRVPLAPELAGYLVLEIAEHADPTGGDVDPKSVFVGEEGTVALVRPRRDAPSGDAEASVRATLGRLLEASGSQTPALAAAARRKSGPGLPVLAEEIEAALIPVNRAAGRRALARLAREVKRVTLGVGRNAMPSNAGEAPPSTRRSSPSHGAVRAAMPSRPPSPSFSPEEDPTTARGQIPDELLRKATPGEWSEMPTIEFETMPRTPSPSQADVDTLIEDFGVSGGGERQHARDLKAMAGLEPTPPPARMGNFDANESASAGPASDGGVESLLALGKDAHDTVRPPGPAESLPQRSADASPPEPAPRVEERRQLPTQPSQIRRSRSSSPSASGGRTAIAVVLALIAVVGGAYGVSQLRPGALANRAPDPVATPTAVRPTQALPACKGALVITDVPAHAEVLVRKGQAPVDVEKMPVGTRLEFVATAEGYSPRRVVVPAGATWEPGSDTKPRFEAAVQLDKSKAKGTTNDPWPPGEPGSEVGGQGPPGTVHVVATPRGAEVWMLAGIGPEVRIEQLRCDQDLDLLIAGPTTFRKRLHVGATDFVLDEQSGAPGSKAAARTARVSAK